MDHAALTRRTNRLSALLDTARTALSARRTSRREAPRFPADDTVPQRHLHALAVLGAARSVVERGWVQNRWYVLQDPAGRRRSFGPTAMGRLDHTQVVEACLVGAVVHAAWQQSPRSEYANPAIDALWHTLYDGQGPASTDPVGPVAPPPVRTARVRDLTRWNDRRDRTKEDVLRLLDRSAARVAAARDPGGALA